MYVYFIFYSCVAAMGLYLWSILGAIYSLGPFNFMLETLYLYLLIPYDCGFNSGFVFSLWKLCQTNTNTLPLAASCQYKNTGIIHVCHEYGVLIGHLFYSIHFPCTEVLSRCAAYVLYKQLNAVRSRFPFSRYTGFIIASRLIVVWSTKLTSFYLGP